MNETKFDGELNSSDRILDFLKRKYIEPTQRQQMESKIVVEVERPKVIAKPLKVKTPEELAEEKRVYENARKMGKKIEIIFIVVLIITGIVALIIGFFYPVK